MYKVVMLISAFFCYFVKNTVQSLLWLMVTFFLGALMMLEVGSEVLAIMLVLVYMGAISVLFLFVMMLLNVSKVELNSLMMNYFPMGFFLGFLLVLVFFFVGVKFFFLGFNYDLMYFGWVDYVYYKVDMELLGYMIYYYFFHYFLFLGLMLLIALLGVVILMS